MTAADNNFTTNNHHHINGNGIGRLLSCSTTVGSSSYNKQFQQQQQCKRLSLDSRTGLDKTTACIDYGLLITLHKCGETGGTRCQLSFTPDAHYHEIHPNAYAPAALFHMRKLGGGGSGVAVFEGHHPVLGDVVMKHGGDKDLKELFALAEIAQELKERGKNHPEAAHWLQSRIPEFRFIYISPHHLGEKRRELWYRLSHMYKYSSRNLLLMAEQEEEHHMQSVPELPVEEDTDVMAEMEMEQATTTPLKKRNRAMPHIPSRNGGLNMTKSGTVSGHRDIAIYSRSSSKNKQCDCNVELLGDSLTVSIPPNDDMKGSDGGGNTPIVIPGEGFVALKSIVKDLVKLLKEHKWKLTLGQKRIGGKNPQTGNLWLYSGKLEGRLLDNLILQKIQLVRYLALLTTQDEQDSHFLREVQEEVVRCEEDGDVTPGDISPLSDSFVGNCIKKNFQDGTGRFPILRELGKQFRDFHQQQQQQNHHHHLNRSNSDSGYSIGGFDTVAPSDELVLTPEEEIPAYHLGLLVRAGSLMGDSFDKVPLEPTVLEMNRFHWRTVLRAAVQPHKINTTTTTTTTTLCMATTRLWTCGLTDAGVHNLFLTEDNLWLFDLGQPQLYSAPGFLTKYLFSFFHTLGMEETPDGATWVRRFDHNPVTNKLRMTPETEHLLEKAYDAFEITLDRIIAELFEGDDSLRWLLIQYVTLQLISDASFCLQRWTIKGGGRTRDANHQTGIEKWLWRAIWDMYVAFDINTNETWTRLYVEHPSFRDSVLFFTDMKDLIGYDPMAELQRIDEKETKEEEERLRQLQQQQQQH